MKEIISKTNRMIATFAKKKKLKMTKALKSLRKRSDRLQKNQRRPWNPTLMKKPLQLFHTSMYNTRPQSNRMIANILANTSVNSSKVIQKHITLSFYSNQWQSISLKNTNRNRCSKMSNRKKHKI